VKTPERGTKRETRNEGATRRIGVVVVVRGGEGGPGLERNEMRRRRESSLRELMEETRISPL